MSTPTPMKHAPSQQGRTPSGQGQQGRTPSQLAAATPPVSTPFSNAAQAAFSPRGQRSSPQQYKKSPATSGLMGQSSMASLNFDSPSTAAAMGALGIGSGFDMSLDGVGGLDTLSAAFASEDEKLRRLEAILKILNEKKGMVSEEGLERLAQRLGMELLSEEHGTPGGRKTKTLAIAGSAIAIDIVLDNNIVQNVTLSYHGSSDSVSKHIEAASQILLKNLQLRPGQSPLTKSLDAFAVNFERLAKLDKLSIVPGLDCHEALAGIFSSLHRLHEWDMEQLRKEPQMAGKSDALLSSSSMCEKHGIPVMHARGQVGLALQYWKELRLVPPTSDSPSDSDDKIWSLLLGCAAIDGVGLPPVRVSDNWITKDIEKQDAPADAQKPVLDWQEPENVSLPQSEENKDAGMELLQPDLSTTRVPRVMFTVTFDPPVILPQNDWSRLYAYANIEPPNIGGGTDFSGRPQAPPPTFDALFFPLPPGAKQDPSEARTITRNRSIQVYDKEKKPATKAHQSTLFIYKPIYAQEVTEMPFSHPQQLEQMLPLLRQYAFLSTLLNKSFASRETGIAEKKDDSNGSKDKLQGSEMTTIQDQLAEFLNSGETQNPSKASTTDLSLDVILWVHPAPHLQVVFPIDSTTANITLRILEGGAVEVVNENILGGTEDEAKAGSTKRQINGKDITKEQLAKVLEHLEDLSKWAEWIRSRLGIKGGL